MWSTLCWFVAGLIYSNAGEWAIHKYVLHGWGAKRDSFWRFHWHDHHRKARQNEHIDAGYHGRLWGLGEEEGLKEGLGLLGLAAVHLPWAWVSPGFVAGVWVSVVAYYLVHRRSHVDGEWARRWLWWHYDHHMGPNQNANWCVTWPGFDWLLGTREPYVGTEREASDRERAKRWRAGRGGVAVEGVGG